ncbi:DNA dC-_dU-editing enzyme APOBEC-3H-like [Rhynchocyon petersi]
MNLLTRETFSSQFNNREKLRRPYYARNAYLCYELDSPQPTKGCFQYKRGDHVEIRFIEEIMSMRLNRAQKYTITCFLTWSPCPSCAQSLVCFIRDHPHWTLNIYTSRLYFHWRWDYIQGLQHLHRHNVSVAVMTRAEFVHGWENFVDNQGEDFEPWENLDSHARRTGRRLQRILFGRGPTPQEPFVTVGVSQDVKNDMGNRNEFDR